MSNLINWSFEGPWEDRQVYIHGDPTTLINQIPEGWDVTWKEPGETLLSAGVFDNVDHDPIFDKVKVVPEIVHKGYVYDPKIGWHWNLPEDERPGQANALILDGVRVLKIFAASGAFSVVLRQKINLDAGAVPFLVRLQPHHYHDLSPGTSRVRITVGDKTSGWMTIGHGLEDHKWKEFSGDLAHTGGELEVKIELESASEGSVNYFLDAVYVGDPVKGDLPKPDLPTYNHPRERYQRVYLLFPQNAGREWLQATLDAGVWEAYKTTFGGSADDAGVGVPQDATIIAVNPSWYENSLEAFYREYYPGTTYLPVEAETPEELERVLATWVETGELPGRMSGDTPAFLSSSVMGLHALDEGEVTDIISEIKRRAPHATPPTVKSYGTDEKMAWLKNIKDIDPDIITIGRLSKGKDSTNVEGPGFDDPIASAVAVYNSCIDIWKKHPYVDYWGVINEQDPPEGHRNVALFFIKLMELVKPHGIKLALFGYSVGVPAIGAVVDGVQEPDEWKAIADTGIFEIADRDGHAIALHEYGYIPQDQPWSVGRFVYLYDHYIKPYGYDIPLFITEWNVAEKWQGHGLDEVSKDVWLEQVSLYDDLCRAFPYVKGVHIFTYTPISAWDHYDFTKKGWTEAYIDYIVSQVPEPPTPGLPHYSQRDPEWAGDEIGVSGRTVGQIGCAMVASAAIAHTLDPHWNPKTLNRWLSRNGGYLPDGRLIWPKVAEAVDGLKFIGYATWRKPGQKADLDLVMRQLQEGPIIFQVDFDPDDGQDDLDTHFVVGTAWLETENGPDIAFIDPWTGKTGTVMQDYNHDGTLEGSIFAMPIFENTKAVDDRWRKAVDVFGVHSAPTLSPSVPVETLVRRLKEYEDVV